MLCLGMKKSLSSLRLELSAQGMAQCTDEKSQEWYYSAIQAPQPIIIYNVKLTWLVKGNSYLVWFSSVWTSSRIVQVLQDRSTLPEADRASEAEPEIDGENEPTS